MSDYISNKEKYKEIQKYVSKFNRSMQELVGYEEEIQTLVLHDFSHDIDSSSLKPFIKKDGPTDARQNILKFLMALNTLSNDDRLIVDHEFIHRGDENWWMGYFSRSQYYRKRKDAVERLYEVLF